ncbi:hypothetical protein ACI3PF_22070, partial [Lactococcus lactis]
IFTRAWMQYSLLGTSMLGQFLILAVAGFLIMNGQIGIGVVMSVGNLSGTAKIKNCPNILVPNKEYCIQARVKI